MKPVHRRLAAVLHADVVGYSRLIEEAETRTVRELQRARREVWEPAIQRHGGRLVGSAGDAILVEFASALAAVACALDLQRASKARAAELPRGRALHLRVGINLGDVVVEENGDLFGEGVNLAQRLEALAEPDGIMVSQGVRDQVERKIAGVRLIDAGAHKVKNIARPVQAWRIAFDDGADRRHPATPHGWWLIDEGGHSESSALPLDAGRLASADGITIGRHSRYCAVVIRHDSVSRRHARLRGSAASVTVEDLGSTNGSFIGSRRLKPFVVAALREGAVLRIGECRFVLQRRPLD